MITLPEQNVGDLMNRVKAKSPLNRFPWEGYFELTYRCVLRCKQCYTACNQYPEQEMSAPEWCRLMDEACDAGLMELIITGGDPMLKGDLFKKVYTHAKRKGLIVTVFTSGTLIDEKWAQFFANDPPFLIEISLYGATEKTYEEVTGVKGSYKRCMKGFEWLDKYKLPLKVKSFIISINKKEIHAIEKIGKSVGQKAFRFDAMTHPTISGNDAPSQYRLTPKEIVELDMEDPVRSRGLKKAYQAPLKKREPEEVKNFYCGAGLVGFWSNPYGKLQVCTIVPGKENQYDWRNGGTFREGFYDFFPKITDSKPKHHYRCEPCNLWEVCERCPAWSSTVHGDLETPVDYVCEVTHRRAMAFGTDPNLFNQSMMYKRITEGKTFPETIVPDEGFHGLQLPVLRSSTPQKSACSNGSCCSSQPEEVT